MFRFFALMFFLLTPLATSISCQSNPVAGNEEGSSPLNDDEVLAYKKAINRCLKMGGTRVIKIEGELRCF